MCTFLIMVTMNKEDFAWQGRFLSPKLLFQMFLLPEPQSQPPHSPSGLLPHGDLAAQGSSKNGAGGSQGFPYQRFHMCASPPTHYYVFPARQGPLRPREHSVASSSISSQGLWGRAGGGGTLPSHVGLALGEFLIPPSWKPIG